MNNYKPKKESSNESSGTSSKDSQQFPSNYETAIKNFQTQNNLNDQQMEMVDNSKSKAKFEKESQKSKYYLNPDPTKGEMIAEFDKWSNYGYQTNPRKIPKGVIPTKAPENVTRVAAINMFIQFRN